MAIITPQFQIDDLPIHKSMAVNKMLKVLSSLKKDPSEKRVITASAGNDNDNLINLFTQMLAALNMLMVLYGTK